MHELLILILIFFLALASPGPDFLMVIRNSLVHGRTKGVATAFGIGLGVQVHIAYTLLGIGYLVRTSVFAFTALKVLGSLYLMYLAYRMLTAPKGADHDIDISSPVRAYTLFQACSAGFWTNVLNPKAILFFFALFSQFVAPTTTTLTIVWYGIVMSLMAFVWFAFVALALTVKPVRARFMRIMQPLEKVMGVMLVALGIRLLFSSAR